MKSLLKIIILCFPFVCISQGYKYTFEIKGIADQEGYLGYHFGNQKFVLDTAKNINERFVFEGAGLPPTGIYFFYSKNAFVEVIVNEPSFSIFTDSEDLIGKMQVEGSRENIVFNQLQKFTLEMQQSANQIIEKLKNENNEEEKQKLNLELDNITENVKQYRTRLADENSGLFVSKFTMAMSKPATPEVSSMLSKEDKIKAYHIYKSRYFENFDLSDGDLLRTPLYHQKIMEYLDEITPLQPDSVIGSVDYILEESVTNKETFRFNLVVLSNKYEASNTMGMDKVFVHIVEKYYLNGQADWASVEFIEKLRKRIEGIKPNLIGKDAPDMVLVDLEMNPIFFREIDARFLVLYFYDPDCGHCKKKTPVLHSQYAGLKAKDVEVIAVNITTDMEKWKSYVTSNNLSFINAADPTVQSNFRFEYDIRSTPTVYILDQNKQIVAKKIEVDNIPKVIDVLIQLEETN